MKKFYIDVFVGCCLSIEINGGMGNFDFYVCLGIELELFVWDCVFYCNGNNEVCIFLNIWEGCYFIIFYGIIEFNNVSLVVCY